MGGGGGGWGVTDLKRATSSTTFFGSYDNKFNNRSIVSEILLLKHENFDGFLSTVLSTSCVHAEKSFNPFKIYPSNNEKNKSIEFSLR